MPGKSDNAPLNVGPQLRSAQVAGLANYGSTGDDAIRGKISTGDIHYDLSSRYLGPSKTNTTQLAGKKEVAQGNEALSEGNLALAEGNIALGEGYPGVRKGNGGQREASRGVR